MEDSRPRKSRGIVTVLVFIILIPIIAAASIAGYIYLPGLLNDSAEPWEKGDRAKVTRSSPKSDEPANTAPAANTSAPVANTTNAANVANTNANINAAPPAPKVKTKFPLAGRWLMTGPDKTTYVFSAPATVGNQQTGTQKVIVSTGKEYLSNYVVLGPNKLRLLSETGSDMGEITYILSGGGKKLEIRLSDGGIMYFDRK